MSNIASPALRAAAPPDAAPPDAAPTAGAPTDADSSDADPAGATPSDDLDGEQQYVMMDYNCPTAVLSAARKITPGMESPTVSPLDEEGWVAVRAMVPRSE